MTIWRGSICRKGCPYGVEMLHLQKLSFKQCIIGYNHAIVHSPVPPWSTCADD